MEGLKPHVVIDGTRKGAAPGSPTEYLVHVVYSAYTLNTAAAAATTTTTTTTGALERPAENSSSVAKGGDQGDDRGTEGTNRSRSRSTSDGSSSSSGGGGGSSRVFPPSSYSGDSYTVARRFSQFEKLHTNIKAILRASPSVGDSSIAFLPKMSVVKSFPPGTPSAVVAHTRSRFVWAVATTCAFEIIMSFVGFPSWPGRRSKLANDRRSATALLLLLLGCHLPWENVVDGGVDVLGTSNSTWKFASRIFSSLPGQLPWQNSKELCKSFGTPSIIF